MRSMLLLSVFLIITACGSRNNKVSAQDTSGTGKVTLIEYSDYGCPACAYFHPIIKSLKKNFGEQLHVEHRFFPLVNQPYGALTARAAQAARNQGKFQEMHNWLFENRERWMNSPNPQPLLVTQARDMGLDVEQFKEDLNAAETQRFVMEQKKSGQALGIDATPTFIINGEILYSNPVTYGEFKNIIEKHLQAEKEN